MFDISWSEMLLCAVVALVVIGPKDLPHALRALGRLLGKARATANEFRGHFDDLMRERELNELRKEVDGLRALGHDMSVGLDPTGTEARSTTDRPPVEPEPAALAPATEAKPGGQPT